jgi:hypothetical protein
MVYLAENIYEKKTWDDFRKDFKWEGAKEQK